MKIFNKAVGVLLLLISAWYLNDFPTARGLLGVGLILYFIVLQRYPNCWLIVVPAILPLLYLAPYSGRLFFDEFDLLIMVTIAGYLWPRKREKKTPATRINIGQILLFIYFIVYSIALLRGLLPLLGINDNSFSSYYSNLNSLRIGKGFFWALCLLPMWRYSEKEIPQQLRQWFTTGVAIGGLCVFLAVLWEKGVIHAIFYAQNRYQLIETLLNFHTEYRATGLFAEMHTGDAATDGYLIWVLPFMGYYLFLQKTKAQAGLAAIGLLGIIYSILVTFSRGLYLGMGVVALLWPMMSVVSHKQKLDKFAVGISFLFGAVLLLFSYVLFKYGGLYSLIGAGALLLSSLVMLDLTQKYSRFLVFSVWGLIVLASLYCLLHGMQSSKWNQNDSSTVLLLTAVSSIAFTAIGVISNKIWGSYSSFQQRLTLGSLFCILMILVIPSLFGSRMNTRFETSKTDLQGRVAHWQNAIHIMDDNVWTTLFGQGIGTFPVTYYWVTEQAKDVGGFSYENENDNTYIAFAGSPDVKLSQRIGLTPNNTYNLAVDVRTADPAALLQIRICHRQLIQPFEWNPTCWATHETVKDTHQQWQHLTYKVESGNLGSLNYYLNAPLVITFENRREYGFNERKQTLLDIDNLSLTNESGEEIIKNGDFEKGIDHWYAFYDFNHLPWHIKNFWVSVYFDSGLMGLISLALLVGYSLFNMVKRAHNQDCFSKVCFLSIIGFLCVGGFGTLIDGPRVSFLFYFTLLINLLPASTANSSTFRVSSHNRISRQTMSTL